MSTLSEQPGPAPKRRADAVRNRDLAVGAAMALLAKPGASLTVEAIAKRAGLGAATVVRAFGGKDALLDAAVSRLLEPSSSAPAICSPRRPPTRPCARSCVS